MLRKPCALALVLTVAVAGCGRPGEEGTPSDRGGRPEAGASGSWREAAREALDRGAAFLRESARDGRWGPEGQPDIGITALAARALLGMPGQDPDALRDTLDWLVSHQKDDGGIYDDKLATYYTSATVLALEASGDQRYDPVLDKAAEFLARVQSDEGEGLMESAEDYGGVGYGGSGVVNMSTTQMAIDAADAAGLPKDHAFYRKALHFLERSQNRSESNDQVHEVDGVKVVPGNDGGGIYRPAASKAGLEELPDGRTVFRSYGSMSYALLKSYLLCDLDARDPRVRAVLDWIGDHWVLDENPGMRHLDAPHARLMGLYYYYLTLGRCLAVAEEQEVPLPETLADWRAGLARAIVSRQEEDGSWVNDAQPRWWEAMPPLATAYAMIALQACLGAG